jgi:hypothetical protein
MSLVAQSAWWNVCMVKCHVCDLTAPCSFVYEHFGQWPTCVVLAFAPRTCARPHGFYEQRALVEPLLMTISSYDFLWGFINAHTELWPKTAFALK